MLDLQGMQVAWQDEESDVLLLRADSGVPAGAQGLGPGRWWPLSWWGWLILCRQQGFDFQLAAPANLRRVWCRRVGLGC